MEGVRLCISLQNWWCKEIPQTLVCQNFKKNLQKYKRTFVRSLLKKFGCGLDLHRIENKKHVSRRVTNCHTQNDFQDWIDYVMLLLQLFALFAPIKPPVLLMCWYIDISWLLFYFIYSPKLHQYMLVVKHYVCEVFILTRELIKDREEFSMAPALKGIGVE